MEQQSIAGLTVLFHTVSARPLQGLIIMLMCVVVFSIKIWLTVVECCSVCVLASLMWKYVCVWGCLKGFSTVARVTLQSPLHTLRAVHLTGIVSLVSIIRRHTDTPAFHIPIVFTESQQRVVVL